MSFYPPYFGAGIRVLQISPDFRFVRVRLGLYFWNRNYVGTQFGGSLYSMIDPFYMLMVMENLGRDYIVWDKAATVKFKRPGRGSCFADLRITEADLSQILSEVEQSGKSNPIFVATIRDENSAVVAEVEKVLSVKKKRV
jgi:hypothetical protein